MICVAQQRWLSGKHNVAPDHLMHLVKAHEFLQPEFVRAMGECVESSKPDRNEKLMFEEALGHLISLRDDLVDASQTLRDMLYETELQERHAAAALTEEVLSKARR